MRKSFNLAFYIWVILEQIAVKVAEFRVVLLEDGAFEWHNDVGFYKDTALENNKTLKMLNKEHDISIIHVFFY